MNLVKKHSLLAAFIVYFVLLAAMIMTNIVHAGLSEYFGATVKISICGNGIIEGGEDCESENLNSSTCQTAGFGPGNLSCDIACTFDTSDCAPAPTPTLTPNPTPVIISPTPTTVPSVATSSDSSPAPTSKPSNLITDIVNILTPDSKPVSLLPASLKWLDLSGVGKILARDIPVVVKLWVEAWRQEDSGNLEKCDANLDRNCDPRDFSVLMYYVNR